MKKEFYSLAYDDNTFALLEQDEENNELIFCSTPYPSPLSETKKDVENVLEEIKEAVPEMPNMKVC